MIDGKNGLTYFAILGMEICCLYSALTAANNSVTNKVSIPLLILIFPASWCVSRLLRLTHWPKPVLTALSWLIWPVIILLMIKIQLFSSTGITDTAWLLAIPKAFSNIFSGFEPALFILFSSIVMWWLGRRAAYVPSAFSAVVTEFQFGLALLATVFFSSYMLDLDQPASLPTAMAFFSLGLLGVSLSHAQENSWLKSWRQGHWSALLLGSIGLILVLGLIISLIVTPGLLEMILSALKWTWGLIERVIGFFASLFPNSGSEAPAPLPPMPAPTPDETGGFHFSWPPWLTSGLKTLWTIIVVGLLAAALWQIASQIFRWLGRKVSVNGGERETLRGAFKMDLLVWLRRFMSRIFGIAAGFRSTAPTMPLPQEIASVRQLYRNFLLWADKNGCPRQPAQTPMEYQAALKEFLPEQEEGLALITGEYMNVRYGSALPAQEDLNRLKQKWNNLRQARFRPPKTGDSPHGDK